MPLHCLYTMSNTTIILLSPLWHSGKQLSLVHNGELFGQNFRILFGSYSHWRLCSWYWFMREQTKYCVTIGVFMLPNHCLNIFPWGFQLGALFNIACLLNIYYKEKESYAASEIFKQNIAHNLSFSFLEI